MYSVLIQNQKTMESFQEFHPLFLEALNQKKIGVCRWMEPGTTVDTALPELSELTEDKEKWRAIIVHLEDEDTMKQYEAFDNNPFDFQINHEDSDYYGENPVPLIRLTHILGGIPKPEVKYKAEIIEEKNRAPKTIYVPVRSKEEEVKYEEYKRLSEQYDFNGKRPSEIILISLRKKAKTEYEHVELTWNNYLEIESSSFWKINHYSSISRFIVFDVAQRGTFEREADLFRFWICVQILATNSIDPNELQAYRLYRMDISLNREALNYSIKKFATNLNGAKYYINRLVQMENQKMLENRKKLPSYQVDVPVVLELPKTSKFNVETDSFSLIPDTLDHDLKKWATMRKESERKLRDVVRQSERALDESSARMRGVCSMTENEVEYLDKFQQKGMKEELKNLYEGIILMQKELPDSRRVSNQFIDRATQNVRNSILARLEGSQIFGVIMIILALLIVTMVPGILYYFIKDAGKVNYMVTYAFIMIDVVVVCIFTMLTIRRGKLVDNIKGYNLELNRAMAKITAHSGLYSQFLSGIASHSRGSSYLQILKRKKFSLNYMQESVRKHMKAIEMTLNTLEKWNRAFYFSDIFEPVYTDDEFNMDVEPADNRLYSFYTGKNYECELNKTGDKVVTPFEFVEKLVLVREELYDE